MPCINFCEIPEAHIASGNQDSFELFARDFLTEILSFEILSEPSRGDVYKRQGMQYPLKEYPLRSDFPLGVSNRIVTETASVTVHTGEMLGVLYQPRADL